MNESRTSSFLAACRGEPVSYTPVWFMRQAGRSLPEYRAIRAGLPMLEACRRPELICEITMQPVRRHKVDAAILFSDIVVPLAAAGVDVDIKPGVGWSWLTDALDGFGAERRAMGGTVTQTLSTRFGALAGPPPAADMEIRASWTPVDPDLTAHINGWCEVLALIAGLPPPGVTELAERRAQ